MFNTNYIAAYFQKFEEIQHDNSSDDEILLKHNKKLIEHIATTISAKDYYKIIFIISSSRQSGSMDYLCAMNKKTGASYV